MSVIQYDIIYFISVYCDENTWKEIYPLKFLWAQYSSIDYVAVV